MGPEFLRVLNVRAVMMDGACDNCADGDCATWDPLTRVVSACSGMDELGQMEALADLFGSLDF